MKMLSVTMFDHAMNGKASENIVEQMKILAARNKRVADRQILIDARRTLRIELAKVESQRNNLLIQTSKNQDLVRDPDWQEEAKYLNEKINTLKAALG